MWGREGERTVHWIILSSTGCAMGPSLHSFRQNGHVHFCTRLPPHTPPAARQIALSRLSLFLRFSLVLSLSLSAEKRHGETRRDRSGTQTGGHGDGCGSCHLTSRARTPRVVCRSRGGGCSPSPCKFPWAAHTVGPQARLPVHGDGCGRDARVAHSRPHTGSARRRGVPSPATGRCSRRRRSASTRARAR